GERAPGDRAAARGVGHLAEPREQLHALLALPRAELQGHAVGAGGAPERERQLRRARRDQRVAGGQRRLPALLVAEGEHLGVLGVAPAAREGLRQRGEALPAPLLAE